MSQATGGTRRILITGASGFIGGRLADHCLDRGYAVRAVYRRAEPPPHLAKLEERGVELRRFDLSGSKDPSELTDSCDLVLHAAAKVLDYGSRGSFVLANVVATERLLSAAVKSRCRKLVFLSSISVHGFGVHVNSTESGPYYQLRSRYQQTKMRAENIVLAAHGDGIRTTVVRPGLVYGPGDTTTLEPLLDMLCRGRLPWLEGFDHLNCPIYVDDLAEAILLAAESSVADGQVYDLTSGEKVSLADAICYAADLLDVGEPWPRISMSVAEAVGAIGEAFSAVTGYRYRPPVTRYLADQLSADFHFDPRKAKQELGFTPRIPWREGLAAAVNAYRARSSRADS